MKCKTAREMNQCLWRCEAQSKLLPCIKPKKEYYETAHLFHFFQRWQAVYFIGNSHGCFLQFDSFRVCPSNQGSELCSPGPSIKNLSGEGQNWQRETKTSYTIAIFARIHLAKPSMCLRLSVWGVSHWCSWLLNYHIFQINYSCFTTK